MTRLNSYLIPTFAVSLTLSALILPWGLAGYQMTGGFSPDHLYLCAALASTSAVAMTLLGAVRRRDLLRIANARTVLEELGRRPLPVRRLVAMAGWSLATLYDELAWGQTLNASALCLRTLLRIGAALALLTAPVLAAAALAPWLFTSIGLAQAPDWRIGLLLAGQVPLWMVAELALPRADGASAPTHGEVRALLAQMGERLGGPGTQIGLAAMTGVEQGLDAVLPLLERRLARATPESASARSSQDGEELIQELHS